MLFIFYTVLTFVFLIYISDMSVNQEKCKPFTQLKLCFILAQKQ